MPNIDKHAPGSFCWLELGTTDQNAAKQFYGSLLGWNSADNPMGGPSEFYTMFSLGGRNIAGGYTLGPDMVAQGVPPHWMIYVCSADADATAAKVKVEGGQTMCDPFSVRDYGRMTVLTDPTGAHISIWEPKSMPGFNVIHEPGSFTWADLMTSDPAKAAKFYESVFGWTIDPGEDKSGYLHLKNGNDYIGGIPPAGALPPGAPPHWLPYIMVESCDASTAKAKSLGAKVYFGPTTMEKVGRWSVVADPQGAVFSLFQKTH